jgi:hypothetical protein
MSSNRDEMLEEMETEARQDQDDVLSGKLAAVKRLRITKITVLLTHGTDQVCLHTDLPSPFPPEVDSDPLVIEFRTTKGKGLEYARRHFSWYGYEPEVIDTVTRQLGPTRSKSLMSGLER